MRGRWALADQTGHVSPPLTKRKLILSIRIGDFLPQLISGSVTQQCPGFQVRQPAPEYRVFLSNDATQSPKR